VQYGVDINYKESENIMNNARDFVNKIKLVLEELENNIIEEILEEIKKLEKAI
jgi:hypothetical protein